MTKIIVTAKDITSKTAVDLSYKLGISTLRAKDGARRTPSEQAKQLKRLVAKQELSYTEEVKAKAKTTAKGERIIQMDQRQGKETKSSKVRAMILAHDKTLGKSALIKKFRDELDFSYSLAYTYYTKNKAILIKSGEYAKMEAQDQAEFQVEMESENRAEAQCS